MREPSLSGKKAKPCNEVQDASAGTVGLHNTDLQENLDLHLNSRFIWHKACSCASQSALLISHQLIFFPRTLLLMLMKSTVGLEGLSWSILARSCLTTAITVGAVVFLLLWPLTSYLLNNLQVVKLLVCQQELTVPYLKPNATLGGDERTVWACFCSPLPAGRLWVGETCQYRQKRLLMNCIQARMQYKHTFKSLAIKPLLFVTGKQNCSHKT